ncbi:site-specific DNA-methyltransferase [Pseudoflavitalea sp. X16]|nr:site-specific DNA-methyltransferase [Paraflavitalea devenefica]
MNTIHPIDCLQGLRQLPDDCVQCCVSSPPYFHQRDYGMEGQFGLESSPEEYVARMVEVFQEVKRVLRPDGVLWLNLGDGYWGSGKAGNNPEYQARHKEFGKPSSEKSRFSKPTTGKHPVLKPKDLIGIPWAVAFALREKGWFLRQEIIWAKPNCMPESISDRCTRNHEQIFMFSRNSQYYYDADAIKTPVLDSSAARMERGMGENHKYVEGVPGGRKHTLLSPRDNKQDQHGPRHKGFNARWKEKAVEGAQPKMANRRTVWKVSTRPLKEKHFAAFPLEIPTLCILAGSKPGDLILDPFMGAGTTAIAAASHQRTFIGFELNPSYVEMAVSRLKKDLGMFMPSPVEDWYTPKI